MRLMVLTCRQFTLVATEYLEEHLSLAARIQAWFHLSWCSRCQAYLRQLRQTITTLANLPRQAPPATLHADLVRRFRESRQ